MKPNAFMYDVAAVVIHKRATNVPALCAYFADSTRDRIRSALQSAAARGLIRCLKRGNNAYWGPRDMTAYDLLPPDKRAAPMAANSIFNIEGVVIPTGRGTPVSPLGAWGEE